MFKKDKIIGYVQIYFKVIGESGTYYVALDCDFSKPLTGRRLRALKKAAKAPYEKTDKIYAVEFCEKEEWEANRSENDIHVKWG